MDEKEKAERLQFLQIEYGKQLLILNNEIVEHWFNETRLLKQIWEGRTIKGRLKHPYINIKPTIENAYALQRKIKAVLDPIVKEMEGLENEKDNKS